MERGFSKYEDYKAASDVGLENQAAYDRYKKIVAEVESIMAKQKLERREAFIYFYLCRIPKGQQSLAVLERTLGEIHRQQEEKLTKALDLYYSGIPSLAEWDKSRKLQLQSVSLPNRKLPLFQLQPHQFFQGRGHWQDWKVRRDDRNFH